MKAKDVILLRDPDPRRRDEVVRVLNGPYECVPVETVAEAHRLLSHTPVPAVVVRGHDSGAPSVAFCRELYPQHPEIKIILLVPDADHVSLIDAFNENCLFRCIFEPAPLATLTSAVRDAVRRYEMDRVQTLLIQRATDIDRQIHAVPYWFYRLRASLGSLARIIASSVWLCFAAGILLLLAGIGCCLVLYYIKSALGIDIFEDKHLRDFIPL
jgi:DNA-binding NtrC family response regulator